MRYSKFFLYLLKIIIMKKGLLLGLMLCSSLFFAQESINTDGFSTEKRHQFYINVYEKLLREEFLSKIEKINVHITENEARTLFGNFKKNLPIKNLSEKEQEKLRKAIFINEPLRNMNGMKPLLQEFYGLSKEFSFSINKIEGNHLHLTVYTTPFLSSGEVLELEF